MELDITGENEDLNLILLYCDIRTGHFGQGSFVSNLISFFKREPNIRITIVKTDSAKAKEVTYTREKGVDILVIPQPECKLFLNTEDNLVQKTYARRLADIMYPYLYEKPNLIFLANSIDYLNVCHELKETFKCCKLLYVHHAWSWKQFINVSDNVFAKKWKAGEENFNPKAFKWNRYQLAMTKAADHVVTVTDQAKNFFFNVLDVDPQKITTVYNGIRMPDSLRSDGDALRKKYGFTCNEKIILFTGRVNQKKGLVFLLKAFKLVAEKNQNVRLIVAGDGSFREFIPLSEPYWSKVTYTGELTSEQILEFYQVADIGVLPSLFEQCSFTAIEMRFHKLPVIVSCVDGLDEMFEHECDCLKIPIHYDENGERILDPSEIHEQLYKLLIDQTLCDKLTKNGYQKAIENFTLEVMGSKYLKIIRSLM